MLKKARIISMIILAASIAVTAGMAVENLVRAEGPPPGCGGGASVGGRYFCSLRYRLTRLASRRRVSSRVLSPAK